MAKRTYGIRYGVILCGIRTMSSESSLRMAELCVAFKNRGVVGFDLAGSEMNNPAALHKEAFQLILENNINCRWRGRAPRVIVHLVSGIGGERRRRAFAD